LETTINRGINIMTTNLRYFQLLQQVEKNPLKPKVVGAFDVASDFALDMQRIAADQKLSEAGRRDAADGLVRKAIRDLRDLKKPLDEYRAKTATMKAAAKLPPYDKADVVGALLRRELREAARTMTAGQRAAKLSGSHRSLALVDAVLEFADDPWMAGVDIFNPNELQIFEEARERRLRDLHWPLLDQVAERENTLEEVQMVIDVARGDVQHASNLPGPAFEAIAAPIEKRVNAPWILSDRKTVCTVMPDGTAEYHAGTPDELRDGVQFPDLQAYLAARAAA
jgi:hypothetical protein